jgi:hypothetical protein
MIKTYDFDGYISMLFCVEGWKWKNRGQEKLNRRKRGMDHTLTHGDDDAEGQFLSTFTVYN